ncbi:hypothetical protein ACLB2K_073096 [Fragaria x ananassa]
MSPSKLQAFYNAIDVFVNPTLRPQGLDLTLMEVMMSGKPVMASRFRSIKGSIVVDDEFGFMFAPNVASLLEALELAVKEGSRSLNNFSRKTKHIKRKYHFIRSAVEDKEIEVVYCKTEDQVADIFTKACDWSGSLDDSKSTSGYAFTIGSGVFSWGSNNQHSVALSTAEAEYVSAAEATSQAIWLRRILEDFGELQPDATPLLCDNQSAIAMIKNPVFHNRTKHNKRKYHFIRSAVEDKEIEVVYCKTEDQVADIFTKALPKERFTYLRGLLGVQQQDIKKEC